MTSLSQERWIETGGEIQQILGGGLQYGDNDSSPEEQVGSCKPLRGPGQVCLFPSAPICFPSSTSLLGMKEAVYTMSSRPIQGRARAVVLNY